MEPEENRVVAAMTFGKRLLYYSQACDEIRNFQAMRTPPPTDKSLPAPSRSGHIFYQPKGLGGAENLWYDPEAYHIVYGQTDPPAKAHAFSDLCKKWAVRLIQNNGQEAGQQPDFLGVYQSRRRQYRVTGACMIHPAGIEKEPYYLFNVQRSLPDIGNVPMFARKWRLSAREQEIVGCLMMDKSNKEIALEMGISINTVKGYLKMLSRKMEVSSRVGIVALLFNR
jgi:DNA-binding CsgD family transcriptional regulator